MNHRILLVEWLLELRETGGSHAPEVKDQAGSRRELSYAIDPATGDRQPWITPKSMVGAFADHLERHHGSACRDLLLGDGFGRPSAQAPNPSRLRFLGSRVEPANGTGRVERYRAAQDRRRGAARVGHLVKAEWLPAGTCVRLWAMIDGRLGPADEEWDGLVQSVLVASLGNAATSTPGWSPYLGAGRSVGNGRTTLVGFRTRDLDLDRVADLAGYLQGLTPARLPQLLDVRAGGKDHARAIVRSAVPSPVSATKWRLDGPLHVGSGASRPGNGSDVATVATDATGKPCVPATSWKGLIRSRAEFILRSLDIEVCEGGTWPDRRPCAGCPVCDIFGGTGQRPGSAGSGYAARVRFESSTIEGGTVGQDHPRTHVAIDRFTGGAAAGLLYSRDVVESGFVDLVITRVPGRAVPGHAEQLIDLALRDLTDGLIGLGGGSSRGYGDLRLVETPAGFDYDTWITTVQALREGQESRNAAH